MLHIYIYIYDISSLRVNRRKVVPDNVLWPRMYIHLRKLYRQYWIWQINDNLRRRHSLLNCRQDICIVISSVQQHRWWCMESMEISWRNQTPKSGDTKPCSVPLESPHIKPNILIIPCPVVASSFSQSKPLSQLQNRLSPLLRLRFWPRSFSFFKGILLPNFKKDLECGAPDHESSAAQRHLQHHRAWEFARLVQYIWSGGQTT